VTQVVVDTVKQAGRAALEPFPGAVAYLVGHGEWLSPWNDRHVGKQGEYASKPTDPLG
jgi:hypothetical protein